VADGDFGHSPPFNVQVTRLHGAITPVSQTSYGMAQGLILWLVHSAGTSLFSILLRGNFIKIDKLIKNKFPQIIARLSTLSFRMHHH
jgi:hypothetical protein